MTFLRSCQLAAVLRQLPICWRRPNPNQRLEVPDFLLFPELNQLPFAGDEVQHAGRRQQTPGGRTRGLPPLSRCHLRPAAPGVTTGVHFVAVTSTTGLHFAKNSGILLNSPFCEKLPTPDPEPSLGGCGRGVERATPAVGWPAVGWSAGQLVSWCIRKREIDTCTNGSRGDSYVSAVEPGASGRF